VLGGLVQSTLNEFFNLLDKFFNVKRQQLFWLE